MPRGKGLATLLPALAALVGLAVGCAAQSPTEATSRPAARSAGALSIPSIAPSISGAPVASSAPIAGGTKLPPRSTTPGKIACETLDCDLASEVCCVDEGVGRCVARTGAKGEQACGAKATSRDCDEALDCRAGETCCRRLDCSGGGSPCVDPGSADACVTRATCAPTEQCFAGDRACLPLSICPNGPCEEGHCPAPRPALACGAAKCAPGQSCCWDPVTRDGTCDCDGSTAGIGTRKLAVFSCESPGDCGGGYGCFSSTGIPSAPSFHCGMVATSCTRVVDGPYLCDQVADCPPLVVGDTSTGALSTLGPVGCRHDPTDPASVKRCVYP